MVTIIIKNFVHYGLHFLAPVAIAKKWDSSQWKKVWLVLVATMAVDLDHLLSTPIYDPGRMSIGNHLLHSYPAIALYCLMLFSKKTRLVAVGLLFHMATDALDYFTLPLLSIF